MQALILLSLLILWTLIGLIPALWLYKRFSKRKSAGLLHNCNTCGKEIASSAETCPDCGARLKIHPILGFIVWLAVIALATVGLVGLVILVRAIIDLFI